MTRDCGHGGAASRRRIGADAARRSMRRQVVTALVAGVLVPFASFAQPSGKVWLVGILSNAPRSADGAAPLELRKALAALGYVEGVNIAYVVRAGEVNSARLPATPATAP